MYLAELHGKLSSKLEAMEDILTSNVFSFLKYATREVFLKGYLNMVGLSVSDADAKEAEFLFWPRFEENTEPDLVVIVGNYYLLIEAKYFSGFAEETKKSKPQLLREIDGGKLEAKNYGKEFRLIVITADYYYKKAKFRIPNEFIHNFKWTNWHLVTAFLENILADSENMRKEDRDFALDLHSLLDRKNLRDFRGTITLERLGTSLTTYPTIFFEARTAKFRGDFIGFVNSLSLDERIKPLRKSIFLSRQKAIFTRLFHVGKLKCTETPIFYKEN